MPTSVIDNLLAASSAPNSAAASGNTAPGQRRTFDDALARAGETSNKPVVAEREVSSPSEGTNGDEQVPEPAESLATDTAAANAAAVNDVANVEDADKAEREDEATEQDAETVAVAEVKVAIAAGVNIETEVGAEELTDEIEAADELVTATEDRGDSSETPRKQPVAGRSEKISVVDETIAPAVQPAVNGQVADQAIAEIEGDPVVIDLNDEALPQEEVVVELETDSAAAAKSTGNDNSPAAVPEVHAAAAVTNTPSTIHSAATAPTANATQPLAASNVAAKVETSTAPPRRRSSNQTVAEVSVDQNSSAVSAGEPSTVDAVSVASDSVAANISEAITALSPAAEQDSSPQRATDSASTPAEKLPPSREPAANAAARWSNLWNEKSAAAGENKPQGNEPHVDAARFVQRVAKAFRAADDAGGSIRLRLSPPELGSLKVEVVLRGGSMFARLEAETTTARSLLVDNLPALRERLAEQNIKIERFDVDLKQDNQPGDNAKNTAFAFDQQRDAQERQANARGKPRITASTGNVAVTAEPPPRTAAGRLNVVI